VAAALCAVITACPADGGSESRSSNPSSGTETPLDELQSLIFADGPTLYSYDIGLRKPSQMAELPSTEVSVAPDARRYVVVDPKRSTASPSEGTPSPVLLLAPMGSEASVTKLGPGHSPVWAPDSASVAAVARARGYFSCPFTPKATTKETVVPEEDCLPAERVVVYTTGDVDEEPATALGAGDGWTLLGWSGDRRIVAIAQGRQPFLVVNQVGAAFQDREVPGFAPQSVRGISPTEYRLLIAQGRKTFLTSPGVGAQPPLQVGDSSVGDGSWSLDGALVAAPLKNARPNGRVKSRLALIDVSANKVLSVPGSMGAQSGVVWSSDSKYFAYLRSSSASTGRRLQAVACSTDFECKPLFNWRSGVRLLALR
jgi:hypothetical protein